MSRIFLAGHRGMVGSAIMRALQARGRDEVITRTHGEADLVDQAAVRALFADERPDTVIMAAAKVGGIHANETYPAEFIYENLMVQANVIHAAWANGVRRLLFLGSSCIYPRMASQPMSEEALLTGPLEPSNEPYAVAKIAGIKMCESYNRQYGTDYRSVMPTNLYGPGDNYHPENSHVIPGLIRRFHEAKRASAQKVVVWGTGKPMREFLFVDDMAQACLHVLDLDRAVYEATTRPMLSHVNIGSGIDVSIAQVAALIGKTVGFGGRIEYDASKPDGAPRKLMDVSRLEALGWKARTPLEEGLEKTYRAFLQTSSVATSGK